jgi:purine-binding chemotaxis protein CheW
MEQIEAFSPHINFSTDGSQYLTFVLGQHEYGMEILKVQEIKAYAPVTPVPDMPVYMKGVANLRGSIIPVIDLRIRFSVPVVEYTPFTVMIVIQVGTKVMGVVVDGVSDVLRIAEADIQPAPDVSLRVDTGFIYGIVQAEDKLVVLLDIEKVLSEEEIAGPNSTAEVRTE